MIDVELRGVGIDKMQPIMSLVDEIQRKKNKNLSPALSNRKKGDAQAGLWVVPYSRFPEIQLMIAKGAHSLVPKHVLAIGHKEWGITIERIINEVWGYPCTPNTKKEVFRFTFDDGQFKAPFDTETRYYMLTSLLERGLLRKAIKADQTNLIVFPEDMKLALINDPRVR